MSKQTMWIKKSIHYWLEPMIQMIAEKLPIYRRRRNRAKYIIRSLDVVCGKSKQDRGQDGNQ